MNTFEFDLQAQLVSENPPVKKGDSVYLVSGIISHDGQPHEGAAAYQYRIAARSVILQSFGKQRGTATDTTGDFLRRDIWVPSQIVRRTLADVQAIITDHGDDLITQSQWRMDREIEDSEDWQRTCLNAFPAALERSRQEVAILKKSAPLPATVIQY